MRFRRFQSRIIVVFMGLFFLVLGAMLFAVDRVNTQHARAQISESLSIGGRAFTRLFDARSERLMEGVRILSGDFALRGAIATRDRDTILSALSNHGARIGAGVAMLVSLDNRMLISTLRPRAAPAAFPFPRLTEIAQLQGQAASLVQLGGRTFQLVVVPVLAPDPIAWVAMGFRVDEKLAQELRTITSAHVSFLRADPDSGEWSVVATTLPPALRDSLREALPSDSIGRDEPFALGLADGEYETRVQPLAAEDDAPVVAVLQLSLNEALAPFVELRWLLLGLTGAGLLVSLAGSVVLARRVTQPVAVLAEGVREIEQGAYGREVALSQQDEFGALAAAFNHMSHGIAEREGRLRFLAFHDVLTGLPNRAALEEQLQRRLAESGPHGRSALLLVALDRFKDINYTLGFQVGDRVLAAVGTRLQGLAGANDLVAHLSGGEFGIVLGVVAGEADALRLAHDIQRNLESPFRIEDQPFEFGAHIGIALYPDHADNANALIRHAEAAMNHAFRMPGGIGLYSSEFDRQSRRRLTLIGEARLALNTEQFMLYYQPKLDLQTRRIAGVESLVRWRHPEHGFISPAEFIPVIEQTALVGPFTASVLNLGLKQAAAWRAAGLPLKVSLNLSARNLTDPQLPEQLAQLLGFWNVPPAQIVLEITESALMLDPDASMKVISQLDALGAGLSIDDYGTGYSSLSFLRRLPLDELKIDKSFVLHMDEDANDEVIVRSTVELAHNLGLKVTAEGVETQAVLDKLGAVGCDSIQGYYISKPLPADALEAWLRESPYRPAA